MPIGINKDKKSSLLFLFWIITQSTFSSRYGGVNGVIKGMKMVAKNEGILSLWKGCGVPIDLWIELQLMILSVAPSRGIHFLV